jgi:hypothetical protein
LEWPTWHKFLITPSKWLTENPYTLGIKKHSEEGYVTYYVKNAPGPIDSEIAMRLGDALHNLRSTLNHLARALVEATKVSFDPRKTSFPIFDTPEGYKSLSRGRVVGLGKHPLELLDGIQPYKGGLGDRLWQLHELDIIDKHRMLLTLASVPVARRLTPSEKEGVERGKAIFGDRFFAFNFVRADPNRTLVPLEAGHELGTFPVSDMDKDMGFAIDIALNEREVFSTLQPASLFLGFLSTQVLRTITKFGGYL